MIKYKIELESVYTPYTLDCYQTFNFDDAIEYEIDNYNDENETNLNYDDFEWRYSNTEYPQALADNRLRLLKENILDDVILDISKDGPPISPAFYNYTTDKAFNIFTVDIKKLDEYISKHQEKYNAEKIKDGPGFLWFGDDNQTKLAFYLDSVSANKYPAESYLMDQFEQVPSYEYLTYKLIKTI